MFLPQSWYEIAAQAMIIFQVPYDNKILTNPPAAPLLIGAVWVDFRQQTVKSHLSALL